MTAINFEIIVENIAVIILSYDQIKVYRSETETGTYAEITTSTTRIELVDAQTDYEYIDRTAPNSIYWYKTSFYNSSTEAESELSTAFQGITAGLYVTLQDIRDEGYAVDVISSDRAAFLSAGWQQWIENKTGTIFHPTDLTLLIDGSDCSTLWLNIPIISIDYLYVNDDFDNAVDSANYVIYNRYYPEDDRKNPRIKLKRSLNASIFVNSFNSGKFNTGHQNQKIIGKFGYVEEDNSVPFAIKRAIMILVGLSVENLADGDIDVMKQGFRIEEVTDRHRVRFADLWDRLGVWNTTGITEIDQALKMYRKPAFIGTSRRWIL